MGDLIFFSGLVVFIMIASIFVVVIGFKKLFRFPDSYRYGARGFGPVSLSLSQVKPMLKRHITSNKSGDLLILFHPNIVVMFQFRKYINSSGAAGLQLAFPETETELRYFMRIKEYFEHSGQRFGIFEEGRKSYRVSLCVDLGESVVAGLTVLQNIVRDCFGENPNASYICAVARNEPPGELFVDRHDLPGLNAATGCQNDEPRLEKNYPFVSSLLEALLALVLWIGFLSLIYGLIVRHLGGHVFGEVNWHVHKLASLGFNWSIKTYDVIFIFFIIFGFIVSYLLRLFPKDRKNKIKQGKIKNNPQEEKNIKATSQLQKILFRFMATAIIAIAVYDWIEPAVGR